MIFFSHLCVFAGNVALCKLGDTAQSSTLDKDFKAGNGVDGNLTGYT